ncbi:MAG: hypothetical protein H6837_08815 [Planctomycetes bacterium]|nr:hypothetical protein [Planctomycetota bacterium]
MSPRTLFAAAMLLCSAVSAQALYSPAYLQSTEGPLYGYYFGRYNTCTYQMVDGEIRGQVKSISEIATRLDYRSHTTSTAMGRTWANVTLKMCDGDYATFTNNLAANRKSSQTTVFSASVTWPTFTGNPLTQPAVFGGTGGHYRFPFSSNWLTLGQKDVLMEFDFKNGTLANNLTWGSTSSYYYYHDGYASYSPTSSLSGSRISIPSTRLNNNSAGVTFRCNDSAHSTTTGSYLYLYGNYYGPWYSNVDWRDKLVMYSVSYYTRPSAPAVHAWGFSTNQTGVDIGTGCNRLHINGPMLLQFFMTPPLSAQSNSYSGYRYLVWPWQTAFAGFKVVGQAAWTDSVSGSLNLSQASENTLPSPPPNGEVRRSATILYPGSSTPIGPYPYYYANPVMRYL